MLRDADSAFVADLLRAHPGVAQRSGSAPYLQEPRGRLAGRGVVLAPGTVAEVSAILAACHAAHVPVVPYGGGTGLVGGQIMSEGPVPVVLSVERLAQIRRLDPVENVAEVGAGVVLDDLRAAAERAGRMFPLALASGGSARIGGLLATNAGGVNVLRYGTARALCLGVEAVLADGRIYRGLSGLRKDNSGYDLRDLLVGSEGTLGVITAATLRLVPRPVGRAVALMAVPGPEAALGLLALAQERFGEAVTAFELISHQGIEFMRETNVPLKMPLGFSAPWMVLVELGLAAGLDPEGAMVGLYEAGAEAGLVQDGVVAQSAAQCDAIWQLREHIPEGNRRIGAVVSHDIALPLGAVPGFIAAAGARLAQMGDFRINCFGHLGDGNLHYNVFPPRGGTRADHDHQRGAIQRAVHDLVHQMGGSFSAEHGVGRLKTGDVLRYGDPVRTEMMRAIKQALDPREILNPGAVLGRRARSE